MDFGSQQESLWIATTNSCIRNWSLKPNNPITSISSSNTNSSHTNLKSTSSSKLPNAGDKQQNMQLHHIQHQHHLNHQDLKHTTNLSMSGMSSSNASNSIGGVTNTDEKSSSSSSLSSSCLIQTPLNTQPLLNIKGTTSIKQYQILNDKRYIVTKDSDENVCVWDVLQAKKCESLGKENFENVVKVRQRLLSVPNWFTVDLKLGVLTITLDENEWNSAWVNFKDMDSNHVRQTQNLELSDAKVNYGYVFLESIFKNCLILNPTRSQICTSVIMPQQQKQQTNNTPSSNPSATSLSSPTSPNINNSQQKQVDDDRNNQAGLLRFTIPEHTPIIISEVAGRTLYRIEVKDLARESEQVALSNFLPNWIIENLLNVIKIIDFSLDC
jgi:hypothetical protein